MLNLSKIRRLRAGTTIEVVNLEREEKTQVTIETPQGVEFVAFPVHSHWAVESLVRYLCLQLGFDVDKGDTKIRWAKDYSDAAERSRSRKDSPKPKVLKIH